MPTTRVVLCALLAAAVACAPPARIDRNDDSDPPASDSDAGDASSSGPDAGADPGTAPDGGDPTDTRPDAGTTDPQNTPPSVSLVTPGPGAGDVSVSFTVFDEESDPVSLVAQWSDDGSSWHPITTPTALTSLGSSAAGVEQTLVWSSGTDVPAREARIRVRLTPRDAHHPGVPAQTGEFVVDNRPQPQGSVVRFSEINGSMQEDWFELVNLGTQPASVAGFQVAWTGPTRAATFAFPAAGQVDASLLTIAPGGRLVVSDQPSPSSGAEPGVLYLGQNISWGSAQVGSAELLDQNGTSIDFVRWEGSSQQPKQGSFQEPKPLYLPADEVSLVRVGSADHDSSSDWCTALASRNAPNPPCAQGAAPTTRVRFSEVSVKADVSSPGKPWIELVNDGSTSVDLTGWIIASIGDRPYRLRAAQVSANRGLYVVREGTGTDTGSVQYTGAAALLPGAALSLRDPAGVPQDFMRFGNSQDPVPPPLTFADSPSVPAPGWNLTLSRADASLGQPDSPSFWCATLPTPGTANGSCLATTTIGWVKITEIAPGSLFPSRLGGLELTNVGTTAVDLNGFHLRWRAEGSTEDGADLFDVPLAPGASVSIVECPASGTRPPNCTHALPWGTLSTVTPAPSCFAELLDDDGHGVDFVRWGASTATPTGGTWTNDVSLSLPSSNSLGRRPYAPDSDRASDWCPQARSLGSPNGGCLP